MRVRFCLCCRRLLGTFEDGMDFADVFGLRRYLVLDCPAAATALLRSDPLILVSPTTFFPPACLSGA